MSSERLGELVDWLIELYDRVGPNQPFCADPRIGIRLYELIAEMKIERLAEPAIKKIYVHTLRVSRAKLDKLEALCKGPATGCGRDETIFDEEVVFRTGVRMAVQVIAPYAVESKGAWTQAVLFDHHGNELACTDVGESLEGEFSICYGEAKYSVYVVGDTGYADNS